jgi:hypothetical protein
MSEHIRTKLQTLLEEYGNTCEWLTEAVIELFENAGWQEPDECYGCNHYIEGCELYQVVKYRQDEMPKITDECPKEKGGK